MANIQIRMVQDLFEFSRCDLNQPIFPSVSGMILHPRCGGIHAANLAKWNSISAARLKVEGFLGRWMSLDFGWRSSRGEFLGVGGRLGKMYGNVAKKFCRLVDEIWWNVVFMPFSQCFGMIVLFLGTRFTCWIVMLVKFTVPFFADVFSTQLRFSCHRVWLWTTCTPCLELLGWRQRVVKGERWWQTNLALSGQGWTTPQECHLLNVKIAFDNVQGAHSFGRIVFPVLLYRWRCSYQGSSSSIVQLYSSSNRRDNMDAMDMFMKSQSPFSSPSVFYSVIPVSPEL